ARHGDRVEAGLGGRGAVRGPRPGDRRAEVDRHPCRSRLRLEFAASRAGGSLRPGRFPGQVRRRLRRRLEQGDERRPLRSRLIGAARGAVDTLDLRAGAEKSAPALLRPAATIPPAAAPACRVRRPSRLIPEFPGFCRRTAPDDVFLTLRSGKFSLTITPYCFDG